MNSKPAFSTFYSIQQYQAYRAHQAKRPDSDGGLQNLEYKAWIDGYRSHLDVMEVALGTYLEAMKISGALSVIQLTKGRGHHWANAWNRYVSDEAEGTWDKSKICLSISKVFTLRGHQAGTTEDWYRELVSTIDAGEFAFFELGDTHSECDATGQTVHVQFEAGWKPRLGTMDRSKRDSPFVPLTDELPQSTVYSVQIPAPTGEMIIANWFNSDDRLFNKIVTAHEPRPSLETSYGVALATELYAKLYGFMSVYVGNTSPKIVVRDDHILIASVNEDLDVDVKGDIAGSVCTDLWWVSMIDRKVLVDLLATKISREDAEAQVAEFIRAGDATIVKMPPGKLNFYHTSSRCDLADFESAPAQVNLDAVTTPYVVISATTLTFKSRRSADQAVAVPTKKPRLS